MAKDAQSLNVEKVEKLILYVKNLVGPKIEAIRLWAEHNPNTN